MSRKRKPNSRNPAAMTAVPRRATGEFVFSKEWAVWLAGKHSEAVDYLDKVLASGDRPTKTHLKTARDILNRPYND